MLAFTSHAGQVATNTQCNQIDTPRKTFDAVYDMEEDTITVVKPKRNKKAIVPVLVTAGAIIGAVNTALFVTVFTITYSLIGR